MAQRIVKLVFSATLVATLVGCDDKPSLPPPGITERQADKAATTEKPRPTTQALATTKVESLTIVPLRAIVPQSWEVATDVGGQTVLKGYTPHSQNEIKFHLAMRTKAPEEQFTRLLDGAKREAAKPEEKDRYKLLDIRDQNGLKVLETQKVITGDASLGQLLNWTIWYCDKKPDAYHIYELNLTDLTWEQYEADKDFLRAIILSVRPSE